MPALLKRSGYRTGGIGKWHLGTLSNKSFDTAYLLGGNSDGVKHWGINDGAPDHNPEETTFEAKRFLANQQGRNDPFFLYVAYTLPHSPYTMSSILPQDPFTGQEPFIGDFPRDKATGLRSLHSRYSEEQKARIWRRRTELREILQAKGLYDKPKDLRLSGLGAVQWLDQEVGDLLDTLEQLRLKDNTLVVFTADHGTEHGHGRGKGTPYNSGIIVPLLMRWPAGAPEGYRDFQLRSEPLSAVDLLPTFLEAAGAASPSEGLDGQSILPLLRHKDATLPDRAIFIESGLTRTAIHDGWKLITIDGGWEKKWPASISPSLCKRAYSDYVQHSDRFYKNMECHPDMCRRVQLYRYLEFNGTETRNVAESNVGTVARLQRLVRDHEWHTQESLTYGDILESPHGSLFQRMGNGSYAHVGNNRGLFDAQRDIRHMNLVGTPSVDCPALFW